MQAFWLLQRDRRAFCVYSQKGISLGFVFLSKTNKKDIGVKTAVTKGKKPKNRENRTF
jgi:hypothetical protein